MASPLTDQFIELYAKRKMVQVYGVDEEDVQLLKEDHPYEFCSRFAIRYKSYVKSVTVNNWLLHQTHDSVELIRVAIDGIINEFDVLKLCNEIGDDKQKAILYARNENEIVRSYCKKVIKGKRKNEKQIIKVH